MKKNKYVVLALACILLSPFFYKYYLNYVIPYNPLAKIDSKATSCSVSKFEKSSYNPVNMSSSHMYDCSVIYNYLSNLKLKPLKYNNYSTNYDILKADYRYLLNFPQPDLYEDLSIFVWKKDLSIIYIDSNNAGFKDGYYKIVDSEFDYEYINELVSLQIINISTNLE